MFGQKRSWQAKGMKCRKCGRDLTAYRGCRDVTLRCPSCGQEFDLRKFASSMDEDFEEAIGFVPMDRI